MIYRFLRRVYKKIFVSISDSWWSGNFESWDTAKRLSDTYNSSGILEKCKNSLLKVKNGEAVYERDSVLFDKIQYSPGLLSGLFKAYLSSDNKLHILDFGGSLGSSYYQNREFLNSAQEVKWCIVEQPQFVECGKEYFENEQLKFFYTIEECMEFCKPNVLLLSGVLQYLEKPFEWIDKFIGLQIPYIIIDRISFLEHTSDVLTIQKVPESIYPASYPAWFFNRDSFIEPFLSRYELFMEFKDSITANTIVENKVCHWEGLIFKIK
jgi:putative methyltransferase (TIGR04325 family)